MKRLASQACAVPLAIAIVAAAVPAQQPQGPQPYVVGNRLGLPVTPGGNAPFDPTSSNVKVYGAIYSAESCSYDSERGVIVVPNRGVPQNVQTNNAWVSFINHDGSVHTARWIGVQNPPERANLTPPLVLNEPYGSDIARGMLYVADRDGGTTPNEQSVAVIRRFDMKTGAPAGETRVDRSRGSTTSRSPTTEPFTPRRRGIAATTRTRRPGRSGRSRRTGLLRSSSRVLPSCSLTASPSTRRAISSSSTSATTRW